MSQVFEAERRDSQHALLSQIAGTPLIGLKKLAADFEGVRIFGKAEFLNPGGSVKDRPALSMIRDGERTGRLGPGRTILDATSGNTGIAYAMIGAALGYPVTLCIPENASKVCRKMIRAYGAELVLTDPAESSDGAVRVCREIYAADPDTYFYPDQYNNPANWRAHFETTGPEILEQTNRSITHFVAGMGTSGTFTGVTRRLKQDLPGVACVAVQPSTGFHGIEGMKHMPSTAEPGFFDPNLPDDTIWIETEDAYRTVKRVAREEGLLLGISSGANLFAARAIAEGLASRGQKGVVVTVLCDGAAKYLGDSFWDEEEL